MTGGRSAGREGDLLPVQMRAAAAAGDSSSLLGRPVEETHQQKERVRPNSWTVQEYKTVIAKRPPQLKQCQGTIERKEKGCKSPPIGRHRHCSSLITVNISSRPSANQLTVRQSVQLAGPFLPTTSTQSGHVGPLLLTLIFRGKLLCFYRTPTEVRCICFCPLLPT